MYIYLINNIVWEFVPEENPDLPGVPLEERYPADYIAALVYVESTEGIEYGYIYDPELRTFSPPPEPEAPEEPEEEGGEEETQPPEEESTSEADELMDILLGVSG